MLEAAVLCQLRHKRRRKTLLFLSPFFACPVFCRLLPPLFSRDSTTFYSYLKRSTKLQQCHGRAQDVGFSPRFRPRKKEREEEEYDSHSERINRISYSLTHPPNPSWCSEKKILRFQRCSQPHLVEHPYPGLKHARMMAESVQELHLGESAARKGATTYFRQHSRLWTPV